jgi:hypothetical protein
MFSCHPLKGKMRNSRIVCLFASVAALATGCQVSFTPPVVNVAPPKAVVTVGVPESYFWDGVEFVGVVGGQYMYLGPGGAWLVCEPFRLDRFHGWERGRPDWRRTAVHNAGWNARGRGPERKEEKHEEQI